MQPETLPNSQQHQSKGHEQGHSSHGQSGPQQGDTVKNGQTYEL